MGPGVRVLIIAVEDPNASMDVRVICRLLHNTTATVVSGGMDYREEFYRCRGVFPRGIQGGLGYYISSHVDQSEYFAHERHLIPIQDPDTFLTVSMSIDLYKGSCDKHER